MPPLLEPPPVEPPVPVPPVEPVVLPPLEELPPVDVPVMVPVLPPLAAPSVEALVPALELVGAPVDPLPVVARPVELASPVVPEVARPVVPPLVSPRVPPLVTPALLLPAAAFPVVPVRPEEDELAVVGACPSTKQIPLTQVWPSGQSPSALHASLPDGRV